VKSCFDSCRSRGLPHNRREDTASLADVYSSRLQPLSVASSMVVRSPVVYYKIIGKGKHYLFFGSRSLKNDVKRLLCVVLKKQKQCCTWCWEFCCSPHVVLNKRFQVPLLARRRKRSWGRDEQALSIRQPLSSHHVDLPLPSTLRYHHARTYGKIIKHATHCIDLASCPQQGRVCALCVCGERKRGSGSVT
jgi:hypothetical protein